MDTKKFYTQKEFAEIFNVSQQAVSKWIKQGRIKAIRLGEKSVRIPASEVNRLLDDGAPLPESSENTRTPVLAGA